jgi:hypothetical protein
VAYHTCPPRAHQGWPAVQARAEGSGCEMRLTGPRWRRRCLERSLGMCERCSLWGRNVRAEHVHHVRGSAKTRSNAPSNLVSLCARCHAALHVRAGSHAYRLTVEESLLFWPTIGILWLLRKIYLAESNRLAAERRVLARASRALAQSETDHGRDRWDERHWAKFNAAAARQAAKVAAEQRRPGAPRRCWCRPGPPCPRCRSVELSSQKNAAICSTT